MYVGVMGVAITPVALRKESVDRNSRCARLVAGRPNVALRKESVDRNPVAVGYLITLGGSLSARRAWIEIITQTKTVTGCVSLSARRAWIEMEITGASRLALDSRSPQGERG